ncbi:MAG: TIR domain-containing protein [Flavobacterium sp.]|nr:MAG: TIR domain-containing protein [Flavobacterium sp.]
MSFISESQLKGYRSSKTTFQTNLNESLKGYRNESKYLKRTVFLSHKHDEMENLDGAIAFLKKEGIDVYVDWLDEGMPKNTSGITASRIKEKIKESDRFIFLASEGAINSKWCNWELGLGDAEKYIHNIALLPVIKDYNSFSGSEYLKIYPYIEYENGNNKYTTGYYIPAGYYVKYPSKNGEQTLMPLKQWLQ